MDDLISRQAAIDMFQNLAYNDWNQGASTTWATAFAESAYLIKGLPAAQTEPRWIPCSEILPEKGRYLVTGKKNRDWYESDTIVTAAFYDGEFWSNNGDIQAEAWMPLPEPYKGEQE